VNSCGTNNDCEIGQRCSRWGVASTATSQCHDLSSGFCWVDSDCSSNYFNFYPDRQCINGGSGVGRCTPFSQLGEVCGTATTTTQCAYYDDTGADGVSRKRQYICNGTNPPRCVKPVPPVGQGAACDATLPFSTPCDAITYCQLPTTQPPNTSQSSNPGTCQPRYNIALGANCSNYFYACQKPNLCQQNNNSVYTCTAPINTFGQACNYSNTTIDTVQCPSSSGNLYCACNNTCAYEQTSSTSSFCGTSTTVNFAAIFNTFPNPLTPAVAQYNGNQRDIADYYCCSYCQSQASTLAVSTGVVIDCEALTIRAVDFCDNTFDGTTRYFQNCDKYTPSIGAGVVAATWSLFTFTILSVASILFAL